MANNLAAFFGDSPELKNVWKVPTRLNILHDGDNHIVYDPITGIEIQRTCIQSHAENFAAGFLNSLKFYATEECEFREPDGTDEYEAYLDGMHIGNELCTKHSENGGTFAI